MPAAKDTAVLHVQTCCLILQDGKRHQPPKPFMVGDSTTVNVMRQQALASTRVATLGRAAEPGPAIKAVEVGNQLRANTGLRLNGDQMKKGSHVFKSRAY